MKAAYARQLLGLVGMAAALAVLAAITFFLVTRPDGDVAAKQADEAKLFGAHDGTPVFTRLLVDVGAARTELVKATDKANDDAIWRIVKPVEQPADAPTVTALLEALASATARATLTEKPDAADLARYGLDAPSFRISATLMRKDGTTRELAFDGGVDNPYDQSMYLLRRDTGAVIQVDASHRTAWMKRPTDFEDRTVLHFERNRVAELRIEQRGEKPLVLSRIAPRNAVSPVANPTDSAQPANGAQRAHTSNAQPANGVQPTNSAETTEPNPASWSLTSPRNEKAQDFIVTPVLWTLSNLRAESREPLGARSAKDFELEPEQLRVTVLDGAGAVLGALELGKDAPPGPDGSPRRWARPLGGDTLFQVASERLEALSGNPEAWVETGHPTSTPSSEK